MAADDERCVNEGEVMTNTAFKNSYPTVQPACNCPHAWLRRSRPLHTGTLRECPVSGAKMAPFRSGRRAADVGPDSPSVGGPSAG